MQIDGTTSLCGLIGNPVEHSISPVIHNTLAQLHSDKLVYTTFKVEGDSLGEAIKGAYALNILGLNVTVPHKEAVIPYLSDIDPLAAAIGAVNTLVRTDNGFKGYNTDISGFERELLDEKIELEDAIVVILGAGGAARAIAFLCAARCAKKIYLLNRSLEKAQNIATAVNNYFNKNIIEPMYLSDYNKIEDNSFIAVQTTSVGLYPDVDKAVIDDKEFYRKVQAGVDIIYNPAKTRFMQLCEESGRPAFNGLKMLLYQGIAAYELWNDTSVSQETAAGVYKEMQHALGIVSDINQRDCFVSQKQKEPAYAKNNIILTGFMGCGKSTFGRWISSNKGYRLIDTDAYIEKKEKRSINEIFATYGEEYFRELETETIKELMQEENCVISVGGGLPVRECNRRLLKQTGTVVYLNTPKDELVRRLSDDRTRPLLAGEDIRAKIDSLMAERESLYTEGADIIVDTKNMTFEQMYQIINRQKNSEADKC